MTTTTEMTAEESVKALLATSDFWPRGRGKKNGREFYVIASRSTPGVAHWTTNYGCTCKGYRRYGKCAHVEAVRMKEALDRAEHAQEVL